jgi:WD40 repeat protein/DNA-binding SARP family transcriptional activator
VADLWQSVDRLLAGCQIGQQPSWTCLLGSRGDWSGPLFGLRFGGGRGMIEFHALGPVSATDGDRELAIGGPRQRRLIAMLLIHRDTVVSVDRLAEAVFAGEPTAAAATTLRSYVARVRRVVDGVPSGPRVITRAPGYMLQVTPDGCDVARFERGVAEAGGCLARGDPGGASLAVRSALDLWRGPAYAEFADEEWAQPEAERLEELRLVACELLVEAELACGRATETIPTLEHLCASEPLREAFRAQLVVALFRTGRQGDALRAARDYRRVLREDLGLDPSPAMVALEGRVHEHDPTLLTADAGVGVVRGYRLGARLGTGRAGSVFLTRAAGTNREVAMRIVSQALADASDFVRSFEATVHRVAALRHPAVVPILDYWREPGAGYVVMRHLAGGTLTDRLASGRLDRAAGVALVTRVGGALVAAADHGIVHGRVCADSVLYDVAGVPFLGDFGLTTGSASAVDDVRGLAVLLGAALGDRTAALADILTQAGAAEVPPTMAQLVSGLSDALADPRFAGGPSLNPYKGLQAFDEADAPDFFGRNDLLDELLARLRCHDHRGRLILVVGGSGSGKSSVVRAGLLPRIRRGEVGGSGTWFVATMLPGSGPFDELAESLRHISTVDDKRLAEDLADTGGIDRALRRIIPDGGQVLLLVDQFEELFTLATPQDQRAFLDGILDATSSPDSRLRVVATLRADFFDRPLADHSFGAAVRDATVTIPAMAPAELEAAIVGPARRVGRDVEPAVVAELVSAVANHPAALPSMQFTLFELAARSTAATLGLIEYRQLGGVSGAIAARAESMYRSLDHADQVAARAIFQRLVVIGTDGVATSRRATRIELSPLAADILIDRWAAARLITLDRDSRTRLPTVELAHEALLSQWPRLEGWIQDDREAIVAVGHLREAAASWLELDRDPGALYRGARLHAALDVVGGADTALLDPERQFLDTSRDVHEAEERARAEAVERQARGNRRLRILLGVVGVALVSALVAGALAINQRRDAEHAQTIATARELAAAADDNVAKDPELATLLALRAVSATRASGGPAVPEAMTALHHAVSSDRVVLTVPGVGGTLAWSPTGKVFVTKGPQNSGVVDIRDATTGASVRRFHAHDIDVNDVAFNADGTLLATTGDDGAVRVWETATGRQVMEYRLPGDAGVWGPSFSPDGTRVAAAWLGVTTRIIDVTTGRALVEMSDGSVTTAFSPDGARLAMGNGRGHPARVVDAATGAEVFNLPDGSAPADVRSVRYSPDGRWLATSSQEGEARLWDASSGHVAYTLTGHAFSTTEAIAWTRDSTKLATVALDGTARVWAIENDGAQPLLTLSDNVQRSGLEGVAFSPHGDRLMASDSGMNAVTVWDVRPAGGGEWASVDGMPGTYNAGAFTPDGRAVLVPAKSDNIVSVDITSGALTTIYQSPPGPQITQLALSPDGTLGATRDDAGGGTTIWTAATGRVITTMPGHVDDLAWSKDSQRLAISTYDGLGSVVVVDRSGRTMRAEHLEPNTQAAAISLTPDGHVVAMVLSSNRDDPSLAVAKIWDWTRDTMVRTFHGQPYQHLAISPNGRQIAVSGLNSGVAEVRDVTSGAVVSTLAAPSRIDDLAFSPDATTIATAHADGTVRLWDARSGLQTLLLHAHEDYVSHVAFSPDGSKLLSVGANGLVHVWALDLDQLINIANSRLTRALTDDECRQYLHVARCDG